MSEHCPYYVGQRVTPCRPVINERAIREGMQPDGVYTISWIGPQRTNNFDAIGEHIVLRFAELQHTPTRTYPEGVGWYWRGFRPVTDISSLEALLNTTPVKTPEPV